MAEKVGSEGYRIRRGRQASCLKLVDLETKEKCGFF